MSGIAGVWNLDGRPVERQLITRIGSRIGHRGRDGSDIWCADTIALCAHVERISAESQSERQPVIDDAGNALVFDGRIDNRNDLIRQLSLCGAAAAAPDTAVALAAFQRWGRSRGSTESSRWRSSMPALISSPSRAIRLGVVRCTTGSTPNGSSSLQRSRQSWPTLSFR